MNAPIVTIDQRRGARPLPKCPDCGGKLHMARFTHRKHEVYITAGCECGYRVRIIRSAPRRLTI